jgi:hypothetical protein
VHARDSCEKNRRAILQFGGDPADAGLAREASGEAVSTRAATGQRHSGRLTTIARAIGAPDARSSECGSSFLELMVALAVVGVAVMILVQQVTITLHEHVQDDEAQFAYRKAIGMLAELQASVDQGVIATPDELDGSGDETLSPILTTRAVDAPDHLMSGNILLASGEWKWYREIRVEPIEGVDRSRFVRILVRRKNDRGGMSVAAATSGVLNVTVKAEPIVQEYDVYVLAIAQAPSLWQPLPGLRAQLEGLATEISGANPNLRLRLHWITNLGYGRDPHYVPYVNETQSSTQAAPWVYWYPGRLPWGAGASALYSAELLGGRVRTEQGVRNGYDEQANAYPYAIADRFNHCMRTPQARALFAQRVAAGLEQADAPPLQVLLADLHQYPERFRNAIFVNLHGEGLPFPPLRNYADAAKDPIGRPGVRVVAHPARLHTPRSGGSLRTQIDELGASILAAAAGADDDAAEDLKNAYDKTVDAGKELDKGSPTGAAKKLTEASDKIATAEDVTSTTRELLLAQAAPLITALSTGATGTSGPELRVYAYKTDPAQGSAVLGEPITVQIMGVDLTAGVNQAGGALAIRRLVGGVDVATGLATGDARDYSHFEESIGLPPTRAAQEKPYEMSYEIGYVGGAQAHTWVRLYNTPLVVPVWNDEGLTPEQRLYGMEYVPAPIAADGFTIDPDTDGTGPKNTARWQITISGAALPAADTCLEIRTRIGTDTTTGRMWPTAHQPQNLSTTYAWWTDSVDDVPLTERYQLLGDPRHNPYADLTAGGASFPHGYNWWFDDLRAGTVDASTAWPCLDRERLHDGFGAGVVEDLPRMLQIWRTALQSAGCVFTNPGGPLAGKLLLGGEIALPGAGVSVHGALYGQSSAVAVDDVSAGSFTQIGASPLYQASSTTLGGRPLLTTSTPGFWVKEWLGELAPDALASGYTTSGNLVVGQNGARRTVRELAAPSGLPRGTDWCYASGTTPGDLGGASLLQIGSELSTFVHLAGQSGERATTATEAHAFAQTVGLAVPSSAPACLPFTLTGRLSATLRQRKWTDSYPDQQAQLLEVLASGTSGHGAAVVRLAPPGSARAAWFVSFADTPTLPGDHRALAYKALAFGLRALFVAGEPVRSDGVEPLPTVEIAEPQPYEKLRLPSHVALSWNTSALRFDGQPYTARYPQEFAANEADLAYVVTYRRLDSDEGWRTVDGEPTEPGTRPSQQSQLIADVSAGGESFVLYLPADRFPAGSYLLRVDCVHRSRHVHVAHHEVRVKIER